MSVRNRALRGLLALCCGAAAGPAVAQSFEMPCPGQVGFDHAPSAWTAPQGDVCGRRTGRQLAQIGTRCHNGNCPVRGTIKPTGMPSIFEIDEVEIDAGKAQPKAPECKPGEVVRRTASGLRCLRLDSNEALQAEQQAQAAVIAGMAALIRRYGLPVKLQTSAPHAQKAIDVVDKQ